jgi:putative oxidoreductase
MKNSFLRPQSLPISVDWGILILRVGISLLMMNHGYSKLLGFMHGDHSFTDPIGLGEELSLIMTIGAEFFCSIFLVLGFLTRPALVALIFTMLVVLFIVHSNDPFDKKEHALLYIIPYLTILLSGPGRFSLDKRLF